MKLNGPQLLITIMIERSQIQIHTTWIHLYKVQNHAKQNNIVRDTHISDKTIKKIKEITVTKIRRMITSRGVNKVVIWNKHVGVFWGLGGWCFIFWLGDVNMNGHYSWLSPPYSLHSSYWHHFMFQKKTWFCDEQYLRVVCIFSLASNLCFWWELTEKKLEDLCNVN